MWCSAVFVVVVTITRVTSVVDIRDNDILSGESLQELVTRTKKSPDDILGPKKNWIKDDKKSSWNVSPNIQSESERILVSGKSDSDVSAEMTALLAEDIKKRLEGLKELETSYINVKSELTNKKIVNNKDKSNESIKHEFQSSLESKISEDKDLDAEESLRIARQYNQYNKNYQKVYEGEIKNPDSPYSNERKYQDSTQSSMNMYGDRGDPYLAQHISSVRTFGAAGIGDNAYAGEKTDHQSPIKSLKQLKQIIPNVINALAEITTPVKPVQTVVSGGHHPIKKPQLEVHKPIASPHVQDLHGKKPLGIEPIFFSKQVVFGIGSDKKLDTKNYGNAYPEVQSYSQPAQAYYPSGYYSPSAYFAPLRDDYPTFNSDPSVYYPPVYSLNPQPQSSYDPALSLYPQGNAYIEPPNSEFKSYYSVDNNYKNNVYPNYVSDPISIYKKDKTIVEEIPRSELRTDSLSKNQTEDEIESEIKKIQRNIETIELELANFLNNTNSIGNKTSEVSKDANFYPSVYRRHVPDDDLDGSSKVNKLCLKGKLDEKNGKFDFVEIDC